MMTKMTGTLQRVFDEEARVQIGPFEYQVLVPEFVRRLLQADVGREVTFHVTEFLEGNQMSNRMVPRRIGFLSELQMEFFDLFCTVDKIGVRKALKAMARPINEIAEAIQREDAKWLSTMPGVGKTTAGQIVATLKTKVVRFALLGGSPSPTGAPPMTVGGAAVMEESYQALMSLGLNPVEARNKLDQALASGEEFADAGAVIGWVFKQKK